jgi:hypothetical protein
MTGGGDRGDKHPFIAKQEIGESFVGVITYVGETFEAQNRMYKAPVLSADGQVLQAEEGKPTVTTMKVNIRLKKLTTIGDDGMVSEEKDEDRSFYVNKWGQFKAIGEACAAADVSDLPVGWTFGMQRVKQTEKNSNAHAFKAKLVAPSE